MIINNLNISCPIESLNQILSSTSLSGTQFHSAPLGGTESSGVWEYCVKLFNAKVQLIYH